jgi:hypothetical protein
MVIIENNEVVYIDKDHLRRCAGPIATSPNGP